MNTYKRILASIVVSSLAGQMLGCTTSSLADIWHDPSFQTSPLSNVLIIAVRKDATERRIWEDAFAVKLADFGVTAVSSYQLFPSAPPDSAEVVSTVESNRFDGILLTLRLPTETTTEHVAGYTTTEQGVRSDPAYGPNRISPNAFVSVGSHYGPFVGPYYYSYQQRYRTYHYEVEHPGYIDSQTVDIRAIDVTTTGSDGRLIWSATSRTPAPGAVTDPQVEIVNLVLPQLIRRNIIGGKK